MDHSCVNLFYEKGYVYLSGRIQFVDGPKHDDFSDFLLDPSETLELFKN